MHRITLRADVLNTTLLIVAVLCVDVLQASESFKTRPGSMSESSPLESYDVFRVFEVFYAPTYQRQFTV